LFTRGAAGVLPTGKFKGKMILLCSLWDREAFAWQGDFYRDMVKANLGEKPTKTSDYGTQIESLHGDLSKNEDGTRTVSYLGGFATGLRPKSVGRKKVSIQPHLPIIPSKIAK
jgi:hypothetical protein